jgi:thiosulfate reductase cytochrome b subunit
VASGVWWRSRSRKSVSIERNALLVTGIEILISHPRFYFGNEGNVDTTPLFSLPIPASRGTVDTGYGYVLPDQNGWSRYLHFQAAWALVLTGLLYVGFGFLSGHFRKNLLPVPEERSPKKLAASLVRHLPFRRPSDEEAWSYNPVRRVTYLFVILVLFPMVIWTGLAMSPALEGAFPIGVILLGDGRPRARCTSSFPLPSCCLSSFTS